MSEGAYDLDLHSRYCVPELDPGPLNQGMKNFAGVVAGVGLAVAVTGAALSFGPVVGALGVIGGLMSSTALGGAISGAIAAAIAGSNTITGIGIGLTVLGIVTEGFLGVLSDETDFTTNSDRLGVIEDAINSGDPSRMLEDSVRKTLERLLDYHNDFLTPSQKHDLRDLGDRAAKGDPTLSDEARPGYCLPTDSNDFWFQGPQEPGGSFYPDNGGFTGASSPLWSLGPTPDLSIGLDNSRDSNRGEGSGGDGRSDFGGISGAGASGVGNNAGGTGANAPGAGNSNHTGVGLSGTGTATGGIGAGTHGAGNSGLGSGEGAANNGHGPQGTGTPSGGHTPGDQLPDGSIYGGGDPGYLSSPILLDLDGDGIEITELSKSTVFMDTSGGGLDHRTAWAGAGDGVLFIDADGNGQLSNSHEYVFTEWADGARDDLDALRRAFGSNGVINLKSANGCTQKTPKGSFLGRLIMRCNCIAVCEVSA